MDEIERLLAESEQDAITASDEAMRLMVEFGNDSLLLGFVATANQLKLEAANLRARSRTMRQQTQSSTRNASIQLLSLAVNDLRVRAGKFKETVMEISRND